MDGSEHPNIHVVAVFLSRCYIETTPYFTSITDARSLQVEEEDWLAGSTLLSVESASEEFSEDHLSIFVQQNFHSFMTYLAYLSSADRDILLSLFVLGSSQTQLGDILQYTQTVCSFRWRVAAKKLGFFVLMQGHPTREQMEAILAKAGQDIAVANYVRLYREHGSYGAVAAELKLHRPDVRRGISVASKAMLDSQDHAEAGLGAYLFGLIDSKAASGTGKSKAALRHGSLHAVRDPDCLGYFRIDVGDAGFGKMFMAKSSLFHHED